MENNILVAEDVAGTDEIDLVVGGFHLADASEKRIRDIADFLANSRVKQIACCHCTGTDSAERLRSILGSRVTLARAGMSWMI